MGTCRNICSKSKFIDHRVEVTESENNYYGNFSVFVIFAPLWNYFLLFSWDEKCNYPNLHSNVDTRQIFLKYDSIWKRQNTRKKQVLACFVNVAFNGMELDQEFIFVLNNEQEQKWGSRGSGELLLLFQYNWARSIVLHILWWKNIILSTLFLQFKKWTPRKWNLSISSLTSFDNITTTAFHCGQGVSADCWTFYTINLWFIISFFQQKNCLFYSKSPTLTNHLYNDLCTVLVVLLHF